jgi:hypothetical protein
MTIFQPSLASSFCFLFVTILISFLAISYDTE